MGLGIILGSLHPKPCSICSIGNMDNSGTLFPARFLGSLSLLGKPALVETEWGLEWEDLGSGPCSAT